MAWDAELYEDRHSFVWKAAADLLQWLDPRPGERILDVGCGTGQLTAQIAESGASVTGLDRSPDMIARARENYPAIPFLQADASDFAVPEPFDAVFSNAVLHWVKDAAAAARCFARALKPGGRFVAEFGGKGNIAALVEAAGVEHPWFFPGIAEYSGVLEAAGFEVRDAQLFDRFTPLDDGPQALRDWMRMFGSSMIPSHNPDAFFEQLENRLRPALFRDGRWHMDYRRLRVRAVLQSTRQ